MPGHLFLIAILLIHYLVVIAPLRPRVRSISSTGQPNSRSRTWNHSRGSKRPRIKPQSSTAPPSIDAQSIKDIPTAKNEKQREMSKWLNESIQQPNILQEPDSYQTSHTVRPPDHYLPQHLWEGYLSTPFLPPISTPCTISEASSSPAKQDTRLSVK
jgi:hypothetical protein